MSSLREHGFLQATHSWAKLGSLLMTHINQLVILTPTEMGLKQATIHKTAVKGNASDPSLLQRFKSQVWVTGDVKSAPFGPEET